MLQTFVLEVVIGETHFEDQREALNYVAYALDLDMDKVAGAVEKKILENSWEDIEELRGCRVEFVILLCDMIKKKKHGKVLNAVIQYYKMNMHGQLRARLTKLIANKSSLYADVIVGSFS